MAVSDSPAALQAERSFRVRAIRAGTSLLPVAWPDLFRLLSSELEVNTFDVDGTKYDDGRV